MNMSLKKKVQDNPDGESITSMSTLMAVFTYMLVNNLDEKDNPPQPKVKRNKKYTNKTHVKYSNKYNQKHRRDKRQSMNYKK